MQRSKKNIKTIILLEGDKMEIELILIIIAIIVALIFEFINGFHDCANAIATVDARYVQL